MFLRVVFTLVLLAGPAFATAPGENFATAIKKKDVKGAQKLLAKGWKYGADGRDVVPTAPVDKFLGGVFKGLEKMFKDTKAESYDCTQAGRELGYMAGEWADENSSLADWIRALPEGFCIDPSAAPTFWFLKRTDLDRPRAIVVIESAGDVPDVIGLYHF